MSTKTYRQLTKEDGRLQEHDEVRQSPRSGGMGCGWESARGYLHGVGANIGAWLDKSDDRWIFEARRPIVGPSECELLTWLIERGGVAGKMGVVGHALNEKEK